MSAAGVLAQSETGEAVGAIVRRRIARRAAALDRDALAAAVTEEIVAELFERRHSVTGTERASAARAARAAIDRTLAFMEDQTA